MKQTVGYRVMKEDLDDALDAFRQLANHYTLEEVYIDDDGVATITITASHHIHNILSGIYADNPRWARAMCDEFGEDEEEEKEDEE